MTREQQEQINSMVRAGYSTAAEIAASIAEMNDGKNLNPSELSAAVQTKLEERRRALDGKGTSAYDRLHGAFEQLERSGVLAREHYWCCQTCAYTAIDAEIAERSEKGEPVRGYVLFHGQDTDRAVETGELLLRYGGVTESPEHEGAAASKKIGEEIVALLQASAFTPRWSGSPDDAIHVPIKWDKRPVDDSAKARRTTPHPHQ